MGETITYYFDEYPVDNHCSCSTYHCSCSTSVSAEEGFNTQILSKIYGLQLENGNLSETDQKKYGMITLSDFGNENVQDWINMLVGLAFEQELNGDTPATESHGPQNGKELYYKVKSMYLVLLSKKDEVVQCHAYKLNTGAVEDAIIGYRVNKENGETVVLKAGVCDMRNKLLLGIDRTGTGAYKIIIPPKSFFLEGRHENVFTKMDKMNLIDGYIMNPKSIKATLPSGVPGN